MICHDERCIFVHVPKTGGTSVELFFTGHDWITENPEDYAIYRRERSSYSDSYGGTLCARDPSYFQRRLAQKHATQAEIQRQVGLECWSTYFTFTWVRNPWERILSIYDHGMRDAPQRMAPSLREWLLRDDPRDHMGQPVLKRWIHDWGAFDFVGRFERLGEDFARLLRLLGVDRSDARLPRERHGSDGRHAAAAYDADTIRRVETFYADEIERFGYRFGDWDRA